MLSRSEPLKTDSVVLDISSAVMLSPQAGYFCENHWYVSMTTADLNTLAQKRKSVALNCLVRTDISAVQRSLSWSLAFFLKINICFFSSVIFLVGCGQALSLSSDNRESNGISCKDSSSPVYCASNQKKKKNRAVQGQQQMQH